MGMLSTNLGFVADTQEYNLPAGLEETVTVEVTDLGGPPYRQLRPAEFADRNTTFFGPSADWLQSGGKGEPAYYYVRGVDPASGVSKMGFIPIPSRTASNNVTVWYHGSRAAVTAIGAEVLDLPVDWHPLVPIRMCILAATADNNPNLSVYVGLYNSRLEKRVAAALRGRTEGGPEFVEVTDDEW